VPIGLRIAIQKSTQILPFIRFGERTTQLRLRRNQNGLTIRHLRNALQAYHGEKWKKEATNSVFHRIKVFNFIVVKLLKNHLTITI
jgi:hypothetical protein